MQSALQVLKGHPEGLPVRTVIARVASRLTLTADEEAPYASNPNIRRFDALVRFNTINPVKAGWLAKDKGLWTLTDAGAEALARYPKAEDLQNAAHQLYRQWKRSDRAARATDPPEVDEAAEAEAVTALEEAQEASWREIERFLANMSPHDFQDLVAALLRAMSYHIAWVAPPGRDGGIDILAHVDPLGAQGPRIVVQVRHRQEKATRDALRTFLAILGDSDVGLFVSSSGFTSEAEREARSQERRRLMLLDRCLTCGLSTTGGSARPIASCFRSRRSTIWHGRGGADRPMGAWLGAAYSSADGWPWQAKWGEWRCEAQE